MRTILIIIFFIVFGYTIWECSKKNYEAGFEKGMEIALIEINYVIRKAAADKENVSALGIQVKKDTVWYYLTPRNFSNKNIVNKNLK